MSAGLLDTSVWIAGEVGRLLDTAALPDEAYVCVVTLAELQAGVLAAPDTRTRVARLATVERLAGLEPLARYGNDVVVIWNPEDDASDMVFKAGYLTAKALSIRAAPNRRRKMSRTAGTKEVPPVRKTRSMPSAP